MQVYNLIGYRANGKGLKIDKMPGMQNHRIALDQRLGLASTEGGLRSTVKLRFKLESWLPCGHLAWWLLHQDETSRQDLEGSGSIFQAP